MCYKMSFFAHAYSIGSAEEGISEDIRVQKRDPVHGRGDRAAQ